MNEKKEIKVLNSFAKDLVTKTTLKKIEKEKVLSEKIHLLKYSIKAALDKKVFSLRRELKKLEKVKKEVFFISINLNLLNLKIKYFDVTFHKKDFKTIKKLFKKIEKEIESV